MKTKLGALGLALGLATAASAEPYVDYTPQKGVWEVRTFKVSPNHVDDYLSGLRRQYVVILEIKKRRGIIDKYQIMTKINSGAGVNVMIIEHYPSLAMLEPDKDRDLAILKETYGNGNKEKFEQIVTKFDKYRTFETDEYWTELEFPH
jgi:hypothetical protein